MRNPDISPKRYTSLAWAAVLGHEETFEFLLNAGHDDEEQSKVLIAVSNISWLILLSCLGLRKQHYSHASCRNETPFA